METFGARLRAARFAAGMTQEELAAASGVPVVTISRLENDHASDRGPRITTTRKLAQALDIETGWLMLGEAAAEVKAEAA